jgi:hypothetical protein
MYRSVTPAERLAEPQLAPERFSSDNFCQQASLYLPTFSRSKCSLLAAAAHPQKQLGVVSCLFDALNHSHRFTTSLKKNNEKQSIRAVNRPLVAGLSNIAFTSSDQFAAADQGRVVCYRAKRSIMI